MHILNYGLANPEWFFQLWMFSILLFWINTIIHVLTEASIQNITECVNSKIYRKRQSKNLLDFIIWNTKKMYNLYRDTFVFTQSCGVQEEKCRDAGRNGFIFGKFFLHPIIFNLHPI